MALKCSISPVWGRLVLYLVREWLMWLNKQSLRFYYTLTQVSSDSRPCFRLSVGKIKVPHYHLSNCTWHYCHNRLREQFWMLSNSSVLTFQSFNTELIFWSQWTQGNSTVDSSRQTLICWRASPPMILDFDWGPGWCLQNIGFPLPELSCTLLHNRKIW